MTYDSMERSVYAGAPWEAYWFSWGINNRYYTSHDAPITIGLNSYVPEAISASGVTKNEEVSSDTLTIELPVDHEIALLFRPFLPPQPVSLVVYRGHVGDSEITTAFTGMVKVADAKETCKLEVITEHNALKENLPSLCWQSGCVHQIFDDGCKLSRQDYFLNATLATVAGVTITSSAFATKPDDYFKGGWIEACGTCMSILAHTGSTVTLFGPIDGLVAGMGVVAYPGCMGTEEACTAYGNMDNYFGCNDIPDTSPFGEGGIL